VLRRAVLRFASAGCCMGLVDRDETFHLDIESDDVAAEIVRLLALGATRVSGDDTFSTLLAPGGHLLCVVPVQSDPALFEAEARRWP
jgi:hypothetical protein